MATMTSSLFHRCRSQSISAVVAALKHASGRAAPLGTQIDCANTTTTPTTIIRNNTYTTATHITRKVDLSSRSSPPSASAISSTWPHHQQQRELQRFASSSAAALEEPTTKRRTTLQTKDPIILVRKTLICASLFVLTKHPMILLLES